MIKYEEIVIKNGLKIWVVKEGLNTLIEKDLTHIKMDINDAEKVFGVNLKGREFSISKYEDSVDITFFDKENIFGFIDRISIDKFNERVN